MLPVEEAVYDLLSVRVDGAEDAREYLERELVLKTQLEPEAFRAKIGERQRPQVLSRYYNLFTHPKTTITPMRTFVNMEQQSGHLRTKIDLEIASSLRSSQ
ncbi:hypothetical protein ES703_123399 [subsurface metagenome]